MDQIVPSRSEREVFDARCLSRRRPCGERDDKSRVAPAASRTVPSSCVASTRRRDVAGNGRRSFSTGRKTCGKRPGARLTAQGCIRHATWRCKPHRTAADGCASNCASNQPAPKVPLGRAPVRPRAHTAYCPRRIPGGGIFIETPRLLLCPAKTQGRPWMRPALPPPSDSGQRSDSPARPAESGRGILRKQAPVSWKPGLTEVGSVGGCSATSGLGSGHSAPVPRRCLSEGRHHPQGQAPARSKRLMVLGSTA